MVLAGGICTPVTRVLVPGFAMLQALSTRNDEPARASRPFDKGRDGFVMGEGAAMMVLEFQLPMPPAPRHRWRLMPRLRMPSLLLPQGPTRSAPTRRHQLRRP